MATAAVALLVIVVTVGAATAVRGHPADGTPAARFWARALPGTPMPASIAALVQRGTDHSPLAEHGRSSDNYLAVACFRYSIHCELPMAGAPAVEGFFFRHSEMRVGEAMTVYIPATPRAAFLPRTAADGIPFDNLTYVLSTFCIVPGSHEANEVRDTFNWCNEPALAGEDKACATSLEGVVLTATRMLGSTTRHSQIVAVASVLPNAGVPPGQYAVQAVTPLVGGGSARFVSCHARPYPYVVYACHSHTTVGSSKAYVVSIRRDAEPAIAMAAVCHFDTSNWNPDHPAFQTLRTKPGGSPVCHFLPYADVVFGVGA